MKKGYIIFSLLIALLFTLPGSPVLADNVYFTSSPSFYVTAGSTYSYLITAKSINNYPLHFSFPDLPGWLSFNTATDTLAGSTQATGRYTIYITVSDGHGSSENQNYYLYVQGSPKPTPTITQTPIPPVSTTPKPTTTPTVTKTITPTPSPTKQTKPTATTSGTAPSVNIYNLSPANGSVTSDTSPTVSGTIQTFFPLDKNNLTVSFDNTDITQNVTVVSTSSSSSEYINTFTFKTKNLSDGVHYLGLTINSPTGIPVPADYTFTIGKATPPQTSGTVSIGKFIQDKGIIILAVLLALLIFIILLAKLVGKRKQQTQNT